MSDDEVSFKPQPESATLSDYWGQFESEVLVALGGIVSDPMFIAVARKIFYAGAVAGANVARRNPSSFVREIIAVTAAGSQGRHDN